MSADPMDELLGAFEGSSVTKLGQSDSRRQQHPRMANYKSGPATAVKEARQEKRRAAILRGQKKQRDDYLAVARGIAREDCPDDDDNEEEDGDEEGDKMETGEEAGQRKLRRGAKGQLMLSEWFDEVPEDFPESWVVAAVPRGKRSLVVAGNGQTKQFGRGGKLLYTFPSNLPGGNRRQEDSIRSATTVLDCVYEWNGGVFHVLDVMVWADESFYDCDTDERFRAVPDVLDSCPKERSVNRRSNLNPYKFVPVPTFSADKDSVYTGLMCHRQLGTGLDGLLCYHRRAHYLPGLRTNPLVLWLKAYMAPELMGAPVPESILETAPSSYRNAEDFKAEYRKQYEERKRRRKERLAAMRDLSEVVAARKAKDGASGMDVQVEKEGAEEEEKEAEQMQ